MNINGIGILLGRNDNSTDTFVRHIDYVAQLVGPEHVGLGLDYVFDPSELNDYLRDNPNVWPSAEGERQTMAMVEPERLAEIAEALLKRGYPESEVQGILGHNNLRVSRQVWK